MKAILCDKFKSSRVADIDRPAPGEGEVTIGVDRVQLSVTECQLYRGQETLHYESIKRRLEAGDAQLFGHEFSGKIDEIGDNVEEFEPGDRVYAAGKIPCDTCAYCRTGYQHYCKDKESIGLERPGALAEYIRLPTYPLRKLPESVSAKEGASMQPLASAVLCVKDANIMAGDVVVVIGCGVMGYQCGQLALLQGAGRVFAIDLVEEKLDLANQHGMETIDPTEEDAIERIFKETDGIGADIVVEAIGGEQSHGSEGTDPLAQAVQMVRSGGKILQVGNINGDITIRPRSLRSKHVDWINPLRGAVATGPNGDTGDLATQYVASGRVSIEEYVTHELDGLDSFEQAVDMTLNKEEYDALGPAQLIV